MFEDVQTCSFLGLTVYTYGLFASLGAALALALALLLSKKRNLSPDIMLLGFVLAIPLGLLFARLVFCLISYGYFFDAIGQPAAMLYFWDGGYSIMGALLGASLAGLITSWIKKVHFGDVIDVLAVSAGLFIAFLRLGEKYTILGRGRSIGVDWMRDSSFLGIREVWSDDVFHAVFRYEAAVAVLLLSVMLCLFFGKKTRAAAKPGDLALVFMTLFGSAQVVLESLRDDGHLLWGFVRASQVISIFLPVAALAVFSVRLIRREALGVRTVFAWVLAAVAILLAVLKEFDIDTSNNLTREYSLMSLAMAVLASTVLYIWKRAKNKRQHS